MTFVALSPDFRTVSACSRLQLSEMPDDRFAISGCGRVRSAQQASSLVGYLAQTADFMRQRMSSASGADWVRMVLSLNEDRAMTWTHILTGMIPARRATVCRF